MYPSSKVGYIYRGLSSVHQPLRDNWALVKTHYMPGDVVCKFTTTIRGIERPEIELIAARVSALDQCAY